jgi:type II pantothenate kinase
MRKLYVSTINLPLSLRDGAAGIDAGLTLTKVVQASGECIEAFAVETNGEATEALTDGAGPLGVTGARGSRVRREGAIVSQEIEAAALGAKLMVATSDDFVLGLLGTGTAFAAVRGEKVAHLGGTPLGGGSFAGIARLIEPSLTYEAMMAAAARGDRRRADVMVSDAYPEGIGRIGADMTAAHLAKRGSASIDDVLAALLNLHGENIAQIGASRAIIAQIPRLVLVGGFAHENPALVASITSMASLFGVQTRLAPHPAWAGALGAALVAAR